MRCWINSKRFPPLPPFRMVQWYRAGIFPLVLSPLALLHVLSHRSVLLFAFQSLHFILLFSFYDLHENLTPCYPKPFCVCVLTPRTFRPRILPHCGPCSVSLPHEELVSEWNMRATLIYHYTTLERDESDNQVTCPPTFSASSREVLSFWTWNTSVAGAVTSVVSYAYPETILCLVSFK